jgi:hypothetical protein
LLKTHITIDEKSFWQSKPPFPRTAEIDLARPCDIPTVFQI